MSLFASDKTSRLQACADVAIWNSHQNAFDWDYRRDPTLKPPEEDFVASLILRGLPQLDSLWRPLFHQWGMRLSLIGVFCHQTPMASFHRDGKNEAPELADLLIVRRHQSRTHPSKQVAVLIQAKMSDKGQIKLPAHDPQLVLYTTWPEFTLKGQKKPTTQFAIGRDRHQALYSGIGTESPHPAHNDGWAGFCPWAMMPPEKQGWVEESLSGYLVKLLNFEAGREFYEVGTTGCHWSELIHYLLEKTFSLPLRTRDMRLRDPRGVAIDLNRMAFVSSDLGLTSAYVSATLAREIQSDESYGPPSDREPEFEEGGEGRVILIETSEAEG
jgi:hypothetical protein